MDRNVVRGVNRQQIPVMIIRMVGKGINIITPAKVLSVDKDTIQYEKDGEIHEISKVDTVVSAVGVRSVNAIAEELREVGIEPVVIGDALKAPGTIHGATEAAVDAVRSL